ncbi:MAG: hypothetical protein H2069_07100 [Legionella sp.]|nr:hypothetical protein [Legionella sp.]
MLMKEQSKIEHLISLGKEQRYLTYRQIENLLPKIDKDYYESLVTLFENMKIKVFQRSPSIQEISSLNVDVQEQDENPDNPEVVSLDQERLPPITQPVFMGGNSLVYDFTYQNNANRFDTNLSRFFLLKNNEKAEKITNTNDPNTYNPTF